MMEDYKRVRTNSDRQKIENQNLKESNEKQKDEGLKLSNYNLELKIQLKSSSGSNLDEQTKDLVKIVNKLKIKLQEGDAKKNHDLQISNEKLEFENQSYEKQVEDLSKNCIDKETKQLMAKNIEDLTKLLEKFSSQGNLVGKDELLFAYKNIVNSGELQIAIQNLKL